MKIRIFALIAGIAFLIAPAARCQSDSMIHINQFPGTTVGDKVANAMKSCPAAPVPCYLVVDASMAVAATGTMPTLCANCHLYDFRSGIPAATVNGQDVTPKSVNAIQKADQFSGANAGAKITACLAALPSGGTCDARGFGASTQTISSTVTVGDGTHTLTLLLDPSTVYVPSASSVSLFAVEEGGSVSGLTCKVTGVSAWNGSCIETSGKISGPGYSLTHIQNLRCNGTGNTTGTCISLPATGSNYIDFLNVSDVQVLGMLDGVSLTTASGATAWVNGNIFSHVVCGGTVNCLYANAQGGEISENQFIGPQEQWEAAGNQLLNFNGTTGAGKINSNTFRDVVAYDVPAASSALSFSTFTYNNQVNGFLCTGGGSGCGVTVTNNGVNNSITDSVQGQIGTYVNLLDTASNQIGYITSDGVNGDFIFNLSQAAKVYKFQHNNGGLEFFAGTGTDHNLYMTSLDGNAAAQIVFQKPIAPPTAGAANNLVCFKSSSGYLALGYCTTAPTGTPPTCTCQ